MPQRIGLYVGSFDPPHIAHKTLVEAARREADLDCVLVLVDLNERYKRMEAKHHREAMVELLVADLAYADTCAPLLRERLAPDAELWELCSAARSLYAPAAIWPIMGASTLDWCLAQASGQRALEGYSIVVNLRDETSQVPASDRLEICTVQAPVLGVSSSEIRQQLFKDGASPWLTPEVQDYIRRNNLYHVAL